MKLFCGHLICEIYRKTIFYVPFVFYIFTVVSSQPHYPHIYFIIVSFSLIHLIIY